MRPTSDSTSATDTARTSSAVTFGAVTSSAVTSRLAWPLALLVLGLCLSGVAGSALLGCTDKPDAKPTPRLDRGTFYCSIKETMEGFPAEGIIAEHLFKKQMLLHGFRMVDTAEKARYVIEGSMEYTYFKELTFDYGGTSQHLEHQFKAVAEITLKDREAPKVSEGAEEFFDIPDPGPESGFIHGRSDRKDARRDIRRKAATVLSQRMMLGKILVNPAVRKLEYELGDPFSQRTFNQVIADYVKMGRAAVPYLLTLLLDDRPVKLKGEFPKLGEEGMDDLRYYHIADRALSDILMRDSGLELDSSEEYYNRVITGWYWAWEEEQGIPKEYQTRPELKEKKAPAPVGD